MIGGTVMSSIETVNWIKAQIKRTNELTEKNLEYEDKQAKLIYIKPLINQELLQQIIIKPFFEMSTEEQFKQYLHALPQFQEINSKDQLQLDIMNGNVLVFIQEEFT